MKLGLCGTLLSVVFKGQCVCVYTCQRERKQRTEDLSLQKQNMTPIINSGCISSADRGVCPLIIVFFMFSVFASVSQNWISTCSTSQVCVEL